MLLTHASSCMHAFACGMLATFAMRSFFSRPSCRPVMGSAPLATRKLKQQALQSGSLEETSKCIQLRCQSLQCQKSFACNSVTPLSADKA